jgi:hypothetical protein
MHEPSLSLNHARQFFSVVQRGGQEKNKSPIKSSDCVGENDDSFNRGLSWCRANAHSVAVAAVPLMNTLLLQ